MCTRSMQPSFPGIHWADNFANYETQDNHELAIFASMVVDSPVEPRESEVPGINDARLDGVASALAENCCG